LSSARSARRCAPARDQFGCVRIAVVRRGIAFAAAMLALALGFCGAALAWLEPVAAADVVWLCKPGTEPDPCRGCLDTTVYSTAGDSHTVSPKQPANPPVDCFYVYPTVS